MRNLAYYLSLTLVCVMIISLLSIVLLLTGVFDFQFNWGYSLGSVLGIPAMWLISVAITMFLRPVILRVIFKESKEYSKTTAIILLILGFFWLCGNIYASSLKRNAIETFEKSNYQKQEYEEEVEEDSEELSFAEELNNALYETCKEINQQAPIRIDEMTLLKGAAYSDRVFTYMYTIELEKTVFTESDWDDFLYEIKENQKREIPALFMRHYNFEFNDVVDFFKATNLKYKYVYFDLNNSFIGTTQIDYKDFKN